MSMLALKECVCALESELQAYIDANSSKKICVYGEFPVDQTAAQAMQASPEHGGCEERADTSTDLFEKVDVGFLKRSEQYLYDIFRRHWEDEIPAISRNKLKHALEDLDIIMSDSEVDTFLETMDTSGDGVLDFEEFKRAVWYPGPIEQWAKTMSLAQLLTDSIPVKESADALRAVSQMSSSDIDRTCAAFAYGLKRMITEHVQILQESFKLQEARNADADNQASKFEIFSLSCGNIKDFHKGISGRVGEENVKLGFVVICT